MSEPVTSTEAQGPSRRGPQPWIVGITAFVAIVSIGLIVVLPRTAREPVAQAPEQKVASAARATQPSERISIPSLGLSIVRPATWVTITADQNTRNLRSVQMDDPEFQALAARYANSPVVAMAKYPEPYADLNPSLKMNVRPVGGFAGRPPEEIVAAALPTFRRGFEDMKILDGPRRTTLAGRPAGFVRIAYTLRTGANAFPASSEVWIVPKGPVFLLIGAGTRADESNGSRSEIRSIIDSLRLD